jgi:hypothetical protein
MPYSSQDEIPASWRDSVSLDADPDNVMPSVDFKTFYHKCMARRGGGWPGELRAQFKHGDCPYFCDTCKVVVPPETIMALKLGKEYDD